MKIPIPELCIVAMVGATGSGKSTFARRHFKPTEILSSDFCRGLVSDDENDQEATNDAFEVLHFVAAKRLAGGRLVVVDATNTQAEARRPLVEQAREHDVLAVAIVLDMPAAVCHERNRGRPDRQFGPHVIRNQQHQLRRSLRGLQKEGFRYVHVLRTPAEVEAAEVVRQPLWTNRRAEHGPFDVVGDVHGCADELEALLQMMGYRQDGGAAWRHPEGRKLVFVGDLVDRGPRTPDVLEAVMASVAAETAICVPGNHDVKLLKALQGRAVKVAHGLERSLEQLAERPQAFREAVARFIDGLVRHCVLDDGKLVVAHAGMKQAYQGRASGRVRAFALFGETTGETDAFGLPVRYNWAAEYRGPARVVYGHTPVPDAEWLNRTMCVDTGCVFGGRLTALRYPEMELVSVPAARVYYEPVRPFTAAASPASAQQEHDALLDLEDVSGKRIVATRRGGKVIVQADQAAAALEVMSRFAADPRWLVYLPPTMSPSETSSREGLLESPAEAFDYFRSHGVAQVVCEEKHMGSRAVLVVARDEGVAARRFGIRDQGAGICYTRTGRRFFDDPAMEAALLDRVRGALDAAGFWDSLQTDWVVLDAELMPWSVKAQGLLREQYAPVGAAAEATLQAAIEALQDRADAGDLLDRQRERLRCARRYREAYRRYCWPVAAVDDLRLAPFHVLATEGAVYFERDHGWHMEALARVCAHDSVLLATRYRVVSLADEAEVAEASEWWETLTAQGGEGMVVKPLAFSVRGPRGLVQPALKCRGPEYLRMVYGPEYSLPENLERLRKRGLSYKRRLALREFSLGVEGLERFIGREPLRRIHECVFGVLALESEPVDPRL